MHKSNKCLTLIATGHDCIYTHGFWLSMVWGYSGKYFAKIDAKATRESSKEYPKMLTTFQVKDREMITKQRRRMVFGWFEDLEHLSRDSEWYITTTCKTSYITHRNAMYDPRRKDPTKIVSLDSAFMVLRSHTISSGHNNHVDERPVH